MSTKTAYDAADVVVQTSPEGRSYIDLEDRKNAKRILSKMNAYNKIRIKKVRKEKGDKVPETA